MKEFIEKLIAKMEEIPTKNKCSECPHKQKCDEIEAMDKDEQVDLCGATIKSLAIDAVKELAEEYINTSTDTSIDTSSGYCEWKPIDEEKSIYKSVCKKQSLYDGNPTESMYEFCPYCGKKIKVVE